MRHARSYVGASETARANIWLFDSKGLVVAGRPEGGISDDKAPFAHAGAGVSPTSSLEEAVRRVKPTVLVGAAAVPAVFTKVRQGRR